jgi:hypothetical protein
MVDGGVVIGGTATLVFGVSGATVWVTVSPVVAFDVVTGPGGAGSGSWAFALADTMPRAPMASAAPAPMVADAILICFGFTSDLSSRSVAS